MIDLNKLKNINEKLTKNTDIKVLIQYYNEALNTLNNISNQLKEIETINNNLENTNKLINKISKKFNKTFYKGTIETGFIHSTVDFKNFIVIRQQLLTQVFNNIKNVKDQYSINIIIELYKNQLILNYNKHNNISLLSLDTTPPKNNISNKEEPLLTATSLTWYDDFEAKIFKNQYIKTDIEYMYKLLTYDSSYTDVLNEINNIYPTFLDDLQNTIETFNKKINEIRSNLKEYIKILIQIKTLLEKYIDID